ncbi:MAG: hypothetical protein HXY37_01200 [Chloroflexi bacterium]|nr:hypothetical protein [Chloroflexota bacterium]
MWLILRQTVLLLTLVFALVGVAVPRAYAHETQRGWSRVAGIPGDVVLEDVVMAGPAVAWAVGRHEQGPPGVVYRLSLVQDRWQVARDATFDQELFGVAALDAERVVVVGAAGLIARRDVGGAWTSERSGSPELRLSAVQLFDDGRAGWAMGAVQRDGRRHAVALRLSDGRWTEAIIEDPGRDSFVEAIHFAPGVGWAVGSHIWGLRGNRWSLASELAFCRAGGCEQRLSGVRAIDAERAWLVGTRLFLCMFCEDQIVLGRHDAGGWRDAFPEGTAALLPPLVPGHYDSATLSGLAFAGADDGLAVGWRRYQDERYDFAIEAFALRYRRGTWSYEALGQRIVPGQVAMADPSHALVVGYGGLLLSYGYGEQGAPPPEVPSPAQPVADPGQPGVRYFAPTGHTLRGAFRCYWEANGGLERFGYPLTEEFSTVSAEDGKTYTVQYFERARFEAHPEYQGTRYAVLLGLLGRWVTAGRADEAPFQPIGPPDTADAHYFPETGHRIAPEFAGFWQANGGLPIHGYPISEPFTEVNAADGLPYLVQYFERSRFEYHPGAGGAPGTVMLGLLGSEYLRAAGWR